MVEQPRVQFGQGRPVVEEDVGAVLGLVNDPIITLALEPGLAQQRVDLPRPTAQGPNPLEPGQAVGQGLGLGRVLELGEGVVALHEADAGGVELPGQPVVAVDVDLGGEGEPGLHADVAEADLRVQEVEVQNALGPKGEDKPGAAVAVAEFDRAARLLTAEDADEAVAQLACADLLLHEVSLAVAALEVEVGGAVAGGEVSGVADETFGFALREGREVFTLDAEGVVDEAVKVNLVGEREVPLEDQSIMAGQNGDE